MKLEDEKIRLEYAQLLPKLGVLMASVVASLKPLEALGAEVKSRVKAWDSVRVKLERANAQVRDIADLVGVRVIVPDARAFESALEMVQNCLVSGGWAIENTELREPLARFSLHTAGQGAIGVEVQVLTAVEEARRAVRHELQYAIGSTPLATATARLDAVLDQFQSLLERPDVHEKRDIHPFIDSHRFLLFPNPDAITSEVPIGMGTEFRIDFLVQKPDATYLLVEIENPQVALFAKAGEFSAGVNHALRQVEDWQEWIEANLPTADKYFPGISSPEAWVVIGRDWPLSDKLRRRLARRNVNLRGRVALRTYDDLLRDAGAYVRSVRNAGGA